MGAVHDERRPPPCGASCGGRTPVPTRRRARRRTPPSPAPRAWAAISAHRSMAVRLPGEPSTPTTRWVAASAPKRGTMATVWWCDGSGGARRCPGAGERSRRAAYLLMMPRRSAWRSRAGQQGIRGIAVEEHRVGGSRVRGATRRGRVSPRPGPVRPHGRRSARTRHVGRGQSPRSGHRERLGIRRRQRGCVPRVLLRDCPSSSEPETRERGRRRVHWPFSGRHHSGAAARASARTQRGGGSCRARCRTSCGVIGPRSLPARRAPQGCPPIGSLRPPRELAVVFAELEPAVEEAQRVREQARADAAHRCLRAVEEADRADSRRCASLARRGSSGGLLRPHGGALDEERAKLDSETREEATGCATSPRHAWRTCRPGARRRLGHRRPAAGRSVHGARELAR